MVDVPRSQDTTWHFTPDKVSPDIWHLILGELAENAQGCEILPLLHVCKAWNSWSKPLLFRGIVLYRLESLEKLAGVIFAHIDDDEQPGHWTRNLMIGAECSSEQALRHILTILIHTPHLEALYMAHDVSPVEMAILNMHKASSLRDLSLSYGESVSLSLQDMLKIIARFERLETLALVIDITKVSPSNTTPPPALYDGFRSLTSLKCDCWVNAEGRHSHAFSVIICQWIFPALQELVLDAECAHCLGQFGKMVARIPRLKSLRLEAGDEEGVAQFFQPGTLNIQRAHIRAPPLVASTQIVANSVETLVLGVDYDEVLEEFLSAMTKMNGHYIKTIQLRLTDVTFGWTRELSEETVDDEIDQRWGALLRYALLLHKNGINLLDEDGCGVFQTSPLL